MGESGRKISQENRERTDGARGGHAQQVRPNTPGGGNSREVTFKAGPMSRSSSGKEENRRAAEHVRAKRPENTAGESRRDLGVS